MVNLSFHHITNISQCEDILKQTYRDQKTLLWKKLGLELQIERRLDHLAATKDQLRSKELELEHARNVAAQLEEHDPGREAYLHSATGFQYQAALLEIRIEKMRPQWLLRKETQLACIEVSLEKMTLLILELETHKAWLLKQAALEQPVAEAPIAEPEEQPAPVAVPVMKTVHIQKEASPHIKRRNPKNDRPLNGYQSG
ncbi:hypothetical protein [Niabella sp.]|uniref:hypothetical protein n=1 Tax=Niabella sp. TaxID=1962976 RepID=UPI002625FDAF|nr:hypothetical protein [Niabella sp.]